MSHSSISLQNRQVIYQVFCGRLEIANIVQHRGKVLAHMVNSIDWLGLKNTLQLTHIYLLGIWQNQGPLVVGEENNEDIRNRDDRYPSPFALSNHKEVNVDLGTIDDLKQLITVLHSFDLKIFVDFVPNHTGLSHPWIAKHPDYYKKGTAFSGDVRELDYSNSLVCQEMSTVLEFIGSTGADGVRVDMAHLIPLSFWKQSIDKIHEKFGNFAFLAEAYSDSLFDLSIQNKLYESGFDAIYDEPLYRNVKGVASNRPLSELISHIQYELTSSQEFWCHYLSNHDDAFPLTISQAEIWHAFIRLLPGWHLIYNGFLQGFEGRLAHHYLQILDRQYGELGALSTRLKEWLEWIAVENPRLDTIALRSNHEIVISWQGNSHIGSATFDFKKGEYLVTYNRENT